MSYNERVVSLFFSTLRAAGILYFGFLALAVQAHTTAIYAGTHLIELEAEPHSPFVGESVKFLFALRDFQYQAIQKPMMVEMTITDSRTKESIYKTKPTLISDGKISYSYTLNREGSFKVALNAWEPDKPDIMRDGVFPIQVRTPPVNYVLVVSLLLIGFLAGVLTKSFFKQW